MATDPLVEVVERVYADFGDRVTLAEVLDGIPPRS